MKSTLFVIGLFLPLYLFSAPVDSTEAKRVALNYYYHLNPNKSYISIKKTITKQFKGIDTRHTVVFENFDFVIVSADNSTVPIFAYSKENSYRELDLPPSFEYWLETEYDELVYYVQSNNISNENTIAKWNEIKNNDFNMNKSTQSVSPLITSHWGQSYPNDGVFECAYNFFVESSDCGCGHCTAGCVATAMSQIMNFWQSPSSDFDWCNMPNELITTTANYSNERDAIAILMSDCGEKAEMEYCSNSCASSSTIGKAKRALQNDYSYSNDMLHRYRRLTISWKPKMRNSLDDGNPILYGGNKPNSEGGGGHAFVCDGYENDNYFHFNWGWRGISDGYFYIDDDDGSPVIDYRKWQEAVFYIHPEQQSNVYCIDCSEVISISNMVSSVNPYNPNFPMITWSGISPVYNYIPFLNPHRPLASDIVYENGEMRLEYFDITAGTIEAENVIIPDKTNVNFRAYDRIVLKPGFHAQAGSKFSASIIPCPNNSKSMKISEQSTTEIETFENINNEKQDVFMIKPNPCSYETSIIYSINENELFEIAIFDIYGKRLKTLIKARQLKGTYNIIININDFPNGLYLCVLKNQKETKTIKFVKISE